LISVFSGRLGFIGYFSFIIAYSVISLGPTKASSSNDAEQVSQ